MGLKTPSHSTTQFNVDMCPTQFNPLTLIPVIASNVTRWVVGNVFQSARHIAMLSWESAHPNGISYAMGFYAGSYYGGYERNVFQSAGHIASSIHPRRFLAHGRKG